MCVISVLAMRAVCVVCTVYAAVLCMRFVLVLCVCFVCVLHVRVLSK